MARKPATVRESPYSGGSRMATAFPGTQAEPEPSETTTSSAPQDRQPATAPRENEPSSSGSKAVSGPASSPRLPQGPSWGGDAGGLVLAVLLWVWVGVPYLRGGTDEVRNVLRAKLVNKDKDGNPLP